MGASMATVDAITKDIYGPKIVDQTNTENVLTRRIEKTSQGTDSHQGGKFVTFPLRVRRNQGVGYRNESEQLPDAGQNGYTSVRVPLRYGYGRVRLTGQTMELVNENYQAFASAMTEEMDGLKTTLVKDTNRILWGNGKGVVGTVDTAAGPVNTLSVGTSDYDIRWFEEDMQVDVLSADGTTVKASNRKVTGIDEDNGDITIDGAAVTVVVGDIITRYGNYGREANGLESLVEDQTSTLFNLSPAAEPKWKGTVEAVNGAISEASMIAFMDKLRRKGGRPTVLMTDLGTRRAYFNLLKQNRQFTNTKNFEGGFEGLAFTYEGEVPMVTDPDAPAGKLWYLDEKRFKIYRTKPWYWEQTDGNIWKWVTDFDAFQAVMKQYWEFALDRRNVHGVQTGITAG